MIEKGDTLGIDFEKGLIHHDGVSYPCPALPKEGLASLTDGGLIPHGKRLLEKA